MINVVEFPDRFFFLVFIEKCCSKSLEEGLFCRPLISSICLFDCRFDIVLPPSKGFSCVHIREYENDLLFVSRKVFVRTSFKEEVACVNKVVNLSSVSIKCIWFLEVTLSFMIDIHCRRGSCQLCHNRFGFCIRFGFWTE